NLISFNLHFDADALEFLGTTIVLEEGLLVVPNTVHPESSPIVVSPDEDNETDSVLTAAFSDSDGLTSSGWPNSPNADGIVLYVARFRAKTGFQQTAIHFTPNAAGTVTGEQAEFQFASESVTVSSAATSGNVDGDGDFDANDTFLIHLVMLSGSDHHLSQSLGASQLTAAEIRRNIIALGSAGDVDGDGDFDANDSFLMHMVQLSASDSQITLNKGASPLTAQQIRSNVRILASTVQQTAVTDALQAQNGSTSAATEGATAVSLIAAHADLRKSPEPFDDSKPTNAAESFGSTKPAEEESAELFETFREWVDAIGTT
ncbi:MAG: hypothetical protein KDA89_24205, partial [Planctomycetaceae bacterium]|nr:hypothetical protein [Planctomycetaceae bacterium]